MRVARQPPVRRAIVGAVIGLLAGLVPAAPALGAGQVQRELARWSASNPRTSAAVWRLDVGGPAVVASYRPDLPRIPASTMKLVTSAGALLTLGPEHRFRTRLLTGPAPRRRGRALVTDLYLVGAGDPVLSTRAYARAHLAGVGGHFGRLLTPLRARGIRTVRGDIVADESYLDSRRLGPLWRSWYHRYSPPLSALTVNQGYAGNGQSSYVSSPPLAAVQRTRGALRGLDIRQTGRLRLGSAPAGARALTAVASPPLRRILGVMNGPSDNHIAETLLKDVGARASGRGTSAAGALHTAALLRQRRVLGARDRLVDGSGLSRANRLSASTLARLLAAADGDGVWGAALIRSLPRGGEGTLVRRFLGGLVRWRVRAKTGYVSGVSTLAGRVVSRRGQRYVFALLMESSDISGARAVQDRVVTLLARGAEDATGTAAGARN